MPTQITALGATKSYPGRTVLDDVSCSVAAGCTGVVGENGSGKSTLLRLFAGVERPDAGEVRVEAEGGVGYLPQEGELPPHATVAEVLAEALRELRAVEGRMRELEARMADGAEQVLTEYGELLTVFEVRGGYDAEARVERALHGLGLAKLPRDRRAGDLSGGEQVRLRLAALLAASPEVLLLDEPTNHLDDAALTWLEDHLRTRPGTTVAVSHDRTFLERAAHTLLEVDADRRTVLRHGNGYAGYLADRAAARRRWEQEYERWRTEVRAQREAAATTARRVAHGRGPSDANKMAYDRAGGRVQQSLAGRVRNAEERLRRLLADPVPEPPQPLRFRAELTSRRLRGPVLAADGVTVADRLTPTDLALRTGERLLVTGPNGAGKSTLLAVLAGELRPDGGTLLRRGRVGHLSQEPAVGAPERTVLEAFARGHRGRSEEHRQSLLELGLFAPAALEARVGELSTGQRQRLALARLLSEPAELLLLDEPTNHLSPGLVEELEAALDAYGGALVVVSHDRRLRRRWKGTELRLPAEEGPCLQERSNP